MCLVWCLVDTLARSIPVVYWFKGEGEGWICDIKLAEFMDRWGVKWELKYSASYFELLSHHEILRNATGMCPLSVKLHNNLSRYGGVHETGYYRCYWYTSLCSNEQRLAVQSFFSVLDRNNLVDFRASIQFQGKNSRQGH